MEFIILWFIVVIIVNVVKKKATSEKKDTYRRQERTPYQAVRRPSSAPRRSVSAPRQESWRNTEEVTQSDISFRGLREGEDELAYLVRRNTAYEKRLEARLVSREN